MPQNRRQRARKSDFKSPATGGRNKCYRNTVKSVYQGCRAGWWNRMLDKKGVVPPESAKMHKTNKRICAAVAWKTANTKCAVDHGRTYTRTRKRTNNIGEYY